MVLMVLVLFSCGTRVHKQELIGRYVWNDGRLDTLDIRANGTYEYWASMSGRKAVNQGTWKLDSLTSTIEFERENFPFLESHTSDGSWFSRISTEGQSVHLLYKPGSKLYLKKIQH